MNKAVRGFLDPWLRRRRWSGGCAVIGAIALCSQWAGGTEVSPPVSTPAADSAAVSSAAASSAAIDELADIMVEAPEPRYVLECFPALLALAAQVFRRRAAAPITVKAGDRVGAARLQLPAQHVAITHTGSIPDISRPAAGGSTSRGRSGTGSCRTRRVVR